MFYSIVMLRKSYTIQRDLMVLMFNIDYCHITAPINKSEGDRCNTVRVNLIILRASLHFEFIFVYNK